MDVTHLHNIPVRHHLSYNTRLLVLIYTMSTHRKSVAFSEGSTVVDGNGEVTEVNGTSDKTSAESHTASEFASICDRSQHANSHKPHQNRSQQTQLSTKSVNSSKA